MSWSAVSKTTGLDFRCELCGKPIDPGSRFTWHRVIGWERSALAPSRRGGSDIALRERVDGWAHDGCITDARNGVSPEQGDLF